MEKEMDEGRKQTLGVIAAICVQKTDCIGGQAITSPRDGVSRQHRFSGGNDAPDRFAMALI
jgi:hypothetical protein